MKNKINLLFLLFACTVFSQNNDTQIKSDARFSFSKNVKIEDNNGNLITDSIAREAYFIKKQLRIDQQTKNSVQSVNQNAVALCTNGNFEEFESVSGTNVLTNFQYTLGIAPNPIQCRTDVSSTFLGINQYNPNNFDVMATTIPSNYLDEYIGNIGGFDQYCLKINYKQSYETMSMVRAKRFKTDNETVVKFNYKAILQTIFNDSHQNEQPYFTARVVNNAGVTVSEFCLIGDPNNCIFTQADIIEGASVTLYTQNWQSGLLDIAAIPNNQEFTIEFFASRCGLGAHFGYAYVDDICLLHSNENLQGSLVLDPLHKICPTLPLSVCGSFTIPNSGGVFATVQSIRLSVRNENNIEVYASTTPASLNLITNRFCFDIAQANLPNTTNGTYNVSATINYNTAQTDCNGTNFNAATDDDANPGWDIWFLNCTNCPINVQTTSLTLCDTNHDGKEFFNLTNANSAIVSPNTGLTFTYFETLANATNDTNPILLFTNYESTSKTVFVRVMESATCYKIIAISLIVKNPAATISGILNICSGSTTLTASAGSSYLWANGQTTQSIVVSAIGNYSVTVTDAFGCTAVGSVTILGNQPAVNPTIVVTQPNCFSTTGTISITSPASEYSYDNGATWTTNSSISNLPVGGYYVQIKTASGCISYSTYVNVYPVLASYPDYIKTDPTSCGDVGSITITTLSDSYSFDDGVTWTSSNTLSNLPSGIYNIRVKDAQGCISNFNSVELNGQFLADAFFTYNNPYCGNLGDITITTPAQDYSFDGGVTWQTSNTLSNLSTGTYFIKIRNAQGCTSPNTYAFLTAFESSYPNYTLVDAGCGTYANITMTDSADFYSFDGGTTWSTNPQALNLTSGQTYHLQIKKGSCLSLVTDVTIYSTYYPLPDATDYHTTYCDNLNDGSENIDISVYKSNIIASSSLFSFRYFTSLTSAENGDWTNEITNVTSYNLSNSNSSVYVRVTSANNCYKVAKLSFQFIDSPIITDLKNNYPLCESSYIIINPTNVYDSYLWSTGATSHLISITQPGNYSLTVTENHGALVCSTTQNFNVFLSSPAVITEIETADWTNNENQITILVTGLGDYEYSLDGINYQDSNVFTGLQSGGYTVYVKDKFNCGEVQEDVFLLMHPYYFTPNNDGVNDTWSVKFSNFEPNLKIVIYDRSGKIITGLSLDEPVWDGTYNGRLLPSDDYWFVVTRENGKEHRGHFALIR